MEEVSSGSLVCECIARKSQAGAPSLSDPQIMLLVMVPMVTVSAVQYFIGLGPYVMPELLFRIYLAAT